jgi:AmmeMemoRadiSam system protein B
MKVRKPAQAGRFYPDNPVDLCQMIQDFIDKARVDAEVEHPVGLVAPHAGYTFSGLTAAHAYKQLQGKRYETVIVIAPSHYASFPGGSIFDGDCYETPLGTVPLDLAMVDKLRNKTEIFTHCPPAHREEHALEVHLPFLQMVFEEFRLVPIIISDQSYANCERIAQAVSTMLADFRKQKTVIIASSDLYHGGSYQKCKEYDSVLADALEQFNPKKFIQGIEEETYMACGYGPIATAMLISQELGAKKARILHRTNSYDAHPVNQSYVVGYLAAAFF